ncbi:MAG: KEOPS complex subunit Pcc1 [Thermoplasmata archaeon]|jgi:hypothetical protein
MENSVNLIIFVKDAEKLLKSVEIENRGYVESLLFNDRIEFFIRNNDIRSLWRTVDDLLMALEISYKIIYGDAFHKQ